jgi:hypothetical protein
MHGCYDGRAREARLMNGVTLLGGRSVSALEVGIALGMNSQAARVLNSRPAQTSGPRTWLQALVTRYATVREAPTMSTRRIQI